MDDDGPPFSVQRARDGDVEIVAPDGEIDLSNVDRLRDDVLAAFGASAAVVALDLRRVGFVDSSGVRLLVEMERHAASDGAEFVVVRGPEHVQRLFDLAGLADRLTFVDDPSEAAGRGSAGAG